jgi:septum site-determining protein MinC
MPLVASHLGGDSGVDAERNPVLPSRLRVRHDDGTPVLVIPDGVPFETLREWVRTRLPEVLPELRDPSGGLARRSCRLDLGERDLELFDVRRLLHLLRDEFQLDVSGLHVTPAAIHRYAERELKLRLVTAPAPGVVPVQVEPPIARPNTAGDAEDDAAAEAPLPRGLAGLPGLADALSALRETTEPVELDAADLEPVVEAAPVAAPAPRTTEEPEVDAQGGRRVLTVRRTLRSGASIRYAGDVHVHGDVNAGAEIRAGGSVVVLGRCRGAVHAGGDGDVTATVLAFELAPTQLRLAGHLALAPSRPPSDGGFAPEIARVDGDRVVLESLRKTR